MQQKGLIQQIPTLIISSEHAIEIENLCFQLGISDFIHKPFESSLVKNRVKNAIKLFSYKNQLEQKVEEQAAAIQKQYQIIQLQAEKLREAKPFNRLMMQYRSAIVEVETKLKVLNEEFSQEYNRNPFESIKSRLKSPESIYEKLERKGFPISVESIEENLTDVAGLRVICSFPDDIYLNLAWVFQLSLNLLGNISCQQYHSGIIYLLWNYHNTNLSACLNRKRLVYALKSVGDVL